MTPAYSTMKIACFTAMERAAGAITAIGAGCVGAARALAVVLTGTAGMPAHAEPMPLLEPALRAQWQAVGRVNAAGFSRTQGCSGTLIAPDLVVTAAHCTAGHLAPDVTRHFVAGWYRGRFTAHREAATVLVHPLYFQTEGLLQRAYDVALLRLAESIPPGLIRPVSLARPEAAVTSDALLMGYLNRRPHALSGSPACPALPAPAPNLLLFGCEVTGGASGGPVIGETAQGPALIGVIVARSGPRGDALAAPVSEWLLEQWQAARDRETARSARAP